MGYLDGSTVVVDAVLTKLGRKRLAQGGALNITQFALGDTGVDYTLWNVDHPSGSNSYGSAITALPQLEAVTSETNALRFKLATYARDTEFIPFLNFPEGTARTINGHGTQYGIIITPSTINATDSAYQYVINDTTPINYQAEGQISIDEGSGPTGFDGGVPSALEIPTPITIVATGALGISGKVVDAQKTLNVQVTGIDTGATDNVSVTVLKNNTTDGVGQTE
tara:strand:+ start:78 stop:749 length:672 start_codon:yes stop_codon:yes gene_type:complete